MNVDGMDREQLLTHAAKCLHCTGDDKHMLAALRTSTLPDLRDYVATAHHPAWQAVTRRTP
ncbi:hypothetical protein [Streptosporangium sp. NPDC004631]